MELMQYVSWANETDPDSFFTSEKVKALYRDHIKAMTSHVNSLTNIAYKDDPTIFAWGEATVVLEKDQLEELTQGDYCKAQF